MIEPVLSALPLPQVASAGRGGSTGSPGVALSLADHEHSWRRVPDSVGLFACTGTRCGWFAVCPACLGSLEVALRVRESLSRVALYWCPAHPVPDEEGV